MKKLIVLSLVIIALVLVACAPAAPTSAPVAPKPEPTKVTEPTKAVAQPPQAPEPTKAVVQPTKAPEPTKAPAVKAPVTVVFWNVWGGTRAPQLRQILDKFEAKNPGIKVENVTLDGNTDTQKMLTAVAGGTVPDLYMTHTNDGDVGESQSVQIVERLHQARQL